MSLGSNSEQCRAPETSSANIEKRAIPASEPHQPQTYNTPLILIPADHMVVEYCDAVPKEAPNRQLQFHRDSNQACLDNMSCVDYAFTLQRDKKLGKSRARTRTRAKQG
jgi:hypothetical protein